MDDSRADVQDVIHVFEVLDDQPALEPRDASPAAVLRGDAVPSVVEDEVERGEISEEKAREFLESGEFEYHHEKAGFQIHGAYGPNNARHQVYGPDEPGTPESNGLLLDGFLFYDRLQGKAVEDAYFDIINATQAPYLDQGLSDDDLARHMEDGHLGTFQVPVDYDHDALEESVTAAVDRLSAAADFVDMVEQVAAEYREEQVGNSGTYQQ